MNNEKVAADICETLELSSPDIAPKDEPETAPILSDLPKELIIDCDIAPEKIIEIFPFIFGHLFPSH